MSNEITDGLLDPNGEYSIFRKDRVGVSGGGGVCAMVRKTLGAKQIDILSDDSPTELLCFDVFSTSTPYRFFVVYRPPDTSRAMITCSMLLNV